MSYFNTNKLDSQLSLEHQFNDKVNDSLNQLAKSLYYSVIYDEGFSSKLNYQDKKNLAALVNKAACSYSKQFSQLLLIAYQLQLTASDNNHQLAFKELDNNQSFNQFNLNL